MICEHGKFCVWKISSLNTPIKYFKKLKERGKKVILCLDIHMINLQDLVLKKVNSWDEMSGIFYLLFVLLGYSFLLI